MQSAGNFLFAWAAEQITFGDDECQLFIHMCHEMLLLSLYEDPLCI